MYVVTYSFSLVPRPEEEKGPGFKVQSSKFHWKTQVSTSGGTEHKAHVIGYMYDCVEIWKIQECENNIIMNRAWKMFLNLDSTSSWELLSMFQLFAHALKIPPPPHTIDILPYARDTRIDTKHNTARRFMIAKYGMQETHSIVIIQRLIWSHKQTVRAPVELADEKKRLPTGKTIARGNLGLHCVSICCFC